MSRALMLQAACLISLAFVFIGCGRSNLHLEEDFVDVSVGLTAVSGPELSESQVTLSLSRFDFTLLSFDQRLTCEGGSSATRRPMARCQPHSFISCRTSGTAT
jgi:hypothetical protein